MNTVRTSIIDGHVHVPLSDDLPNGTEVVVQIFAIESDARPGDGVWDDSPAGIEAWLKQYETLEPLDLTEQDRSKMATAHQDQKDWEKERFSEHAETQRKLWE